MLQISFTSRNIWGKILPPVARSSHQEVYKQKVVLKTFANFTRKHLCQSLFFKQSYKPQPCEFCEISRNTFFHRTPLLAASQLLMTSQTSMRSQLLASLLQASILHNILLIHTWKELIKKVNICIVSILCFQHLLPINISTCP